ncbi:MAG: hypothetical protein A3G37_01530 [Omnitrophica WOR_2 bacterium RIFCSPLOWO2_12_FULL_46_30]|nr:MAG: hypothetical protein A3D27_01170 [Omnitrophica WOR_2 bacterium RIFCSPHIGHO2_02_FULL_46_37]OGX52264.1 MAG: hypothetical protein A3G37_01530 [Omnitrophica WOR_2 bacterium RIFCSPLOWO2_12_FULL_46_30]
MADFLDPDPALAGEGSEKIMLKRILPALEEIIYPRYCLLCHIRIALENQLRGVICRDCIEKIKPNRPPFCRKCGRKILKFEAPENVCAECSKTQFCFERAWASCTYEGVIKEMVHNLKYGNKIMLAKVLSQMMIDFVSDYHLPLEACDCAIAIPLSPRKLREREFNQAEALADNLCAHIGLKLLKNNLKRIRDTRSQTELEKSRRWQNMQGAFALREPGAVQGKTILLIDDVLTTGATASEAARALKNAGAAGVYVLTLAN